MPCTIEHLLKSPSLPSLPSVAVELLDLTKDPSSTQSDFVRTTQSDPAIAAKILQLSNSSFFGIRTEVTTIQKAISMLGTRAVTSLALSFSIARQSLGDGEVSEHFRSFWQRSVLHAIACEAMTDRQTEHCSSELFLAGLMLDIGRLAMLKVLGQEYGAVLNDWARSRKSLCEMEQERFGFDHAEAGGALLNDWGFPPSLIEAVKRHHDTGSIDDGDRELQETLKLSRVASCLGSYFFDAQTREALSELESASQTCLEMDRVETLALVETVADRFRESASLFDADAYSLPDPADLMAEANRQLATIAVESEKSQANLAGEVEALRQQAINDPLTGVYNRAYFDDVLGKESDLCRRNASSMGVIFLDIDHFKRFNDTYGHQFGDEVLCDVARVLKAELRESDVLARYGGEEFVILARNPTEDGLRMLCERLRSAVEASRSEKNGDYVSVTVSVGGAFIRPSRQEPSLVERLVGEADEAMYEAKHGGRNQTRFRSLISDAARRASLAVDQARFCDWLVSEGHLCVDQVKLLRRDLARSPERVGELAVRFDFLSDSEVEVVLTRQKEVKGLQRFGEIAVGQGLLGEDAVTKLLAVQAENPQHAARLLVERGLADPMHAASWVEAYYGHVCSELQTV